MSETALSPAQLSEEISRRRTFAIIQPSKGHAKPIELRKVWNVRLCKDNPLQ